MGDISYNTRWLNRHGLFGEPSTRPPPKRYDFLDLVKATVFLLVCLAIDDWTQSNFTCCGALWMSYVLSIIFVDQPIKDHVGGFEYIQDKK